MLSRVLTVVALAASAVFASGCKSSIYVPEEIKPAMRSMSSELDRGEAAMNRVVDSLRGLMKADMDVPAAAREFQDSLAQLSGVVEDVRGVRPATSAKTGFLARWDEDIENMQNQQLRDASRENRQATMDALTELDKRLDRLRDDFQPFYNDLQELSNYLTRTPTPEGLRSVKGTVSDLISRRNTIFDRINSAQAQLAKLIG